MKNIRKLITLILAVVSVLAVATTALAAYSTMYVNCPLGETVRLRKTASSSGVILANISRGTAVQAEPYNSNWHKVKYNNQTEYMMSSFLSSSRPTSSTPWLDRYGVTTLSSSSGSTKYIKTLQCDLMALGYNLTPYYDDGYYGPTTEGAVFSFQMSHGLEADGICGNKTKEALYKALFGD